MFSQRLKLLRKEKHKTQQDIADFLKIQRSTYGEYERGRIMPPYDKIKKLADYLEVSVDYLMGTTNFRTVNDKIDTVTKREITDVSKTLTHLIEELKAADNIVRLDGVDLDEESKSLLLSSLESSLKLGNILKRKDEK